MRSSRAGDKRREADKEEGRRKRWNGMRGEEDEQRGDEEQEEEVGRKEREEEEK